MPLRLNIKTDYAIRILTELHIRPGESTGEELSGSMGISYAYFQKVITVLKRAGYVQSIQGCRGGYHLKRGAEEISVYDVLVEMEGDICIDRCLELEGLPGKKGHPEKMVCQYLNELQEMIVEKLKKKRISDFGIWPPNGIAPIQGEGCAPMK